jgi:hypothetical protein
MVFVEDPKGQPIAGVGDPARRNNRLDPGEKGKPRSRVVIPASGEAANPAEPETQYPPAENFSEQELAHAVAAFVKFLREERARYYPQGMPLSLKTKSFLARFFEPALLGQVRIAKMAGGRIPDPSFYEEAREKGFKNLPDLKHQSSVTFLDVVVFNEQVTERALFHALVYATQVQMLGVDRFARLFVRGFLRTKSYFMVPLKAHAFALDCQFAENRERGFSVETEVSRWLREGRY